MPDAHTPCLQNPWNMCYVRRRKQHSPLGGTPCKDRSPRIPRAGGQIHISCRFDQPARRWMCPLGWSCKNSSSRRAVKMYFYTTIPMDTSIDGLVDQNDKKYGF